MCIISIFLCFALVPKLVQRTVDFHWYFLQSFKHVILFFLGMGIMVDFLKHEGTTDREGQIEDVCKNPRLVGKRML